MVTATVYANLVKMSVSGTPGTGTITLGTAIAPFFGTSELANGGVYSYSLIDGNNVGSGHGTYSSSGTTLTRDPAERCNVSGTPQSTPMSLSSSAVVAFNGFLASDLAGLLNPWLSQSSAYTASSTDRVLANTVGSAWTLTLPASPIVDYEVWVADGNANFAVNNLTVSPNGSTIEGSASNAVVSTNNQVIQFVYNGITWKLYALEPYAGTSTIPPIQFTSGTNLTTPKAGAMEYDGSVPYFTVAANERGVMLTEQFIILSSPYTLASQTGAQKLFNATTNGAVTLGAATYEFICQFALSSMSASSGSFGFALGGTATFSQSWVSNALKETTLSTAFAMQSTYNTAANTTLVTANTSTSAVAIINGIIRVTVAGTIIPQVSLGVGAAAIVATNSFFSIWPKGTSSVASIGNWSY
jgi:hypothetical protein